MKQVMGLPDEVVNFNIDNFLTNEVGYKTKIKVDDNWLYKY